MRGERYAHCREPGEIVDMRKDAGGHHEKKNRHQCGEIESKVLNMRRIVHLKYKTHMERPHTQMAYHTQVQKQQKTSTTVHAFHEPPVDQIEARKRDINLTESPCRIGLALSYSLIRIFPRKKKEKGKRKSQEQNLEPNGDSSTNPCSPEPT